MDTSSDRPMGQGPASFMARCDERTNVIGLVTYTAGSLTDVKGLMGSKFGEIIGTGSRAGFDDFISNLRRGGVTTGVELVVDLNHGPTVMIFCGAESADRIYLVADKTVDDLIAIMEDGEINKDHEWGPHLHYLKHWLLEARWPIPQDENVLDEMTRLNNEIVNTSRDLAKRNKELTLGRREKRITISSIREAVVVTDHLLRITRMNHMAQELTGWQIDEAEGRPVGEVVTFLLDKDGQRIESTFWGSLQSGNVTSLPQNCFLSGKDGSPGRSNKASLRSWTNSAAVLAWSSSSGT